MSQPSKTVDLEFLDPAKIVATIRLLRGRIETRFPDSGLSTVCQRLLTIAERADEQSRALSAPLHTLRIGLTLVVILLAAGVTMVTGFIQIRANEIDVTEFVQVLEAGINDLIMIGAGIFFVFTLELRIKRKRVLTAIHQLRALAHVIDMHQLTKDPERLMSPVAKTEGPGKHNMTAGQLGRYLDYCSEMLSLVGKLAAVYIQQFPDHIALASVNEIESLTTGLSRKIWQKIMILHSRHPSS